jgi:hypothetical protein
MALLLRHLIRPVLAAIALTTAFAQPQPAKDPARSLRFYYISFSNTGDADGDLDAAFLLRNGRKNVPFQLSANAFSDTADYTGPVPVVLFREKRTETGVERENLGQLDFPAEWKGVLLLVSRDPANPLLPFHFHPVEYWAPSVPDQHVRILNLCPYPLAAKVGANQASVGAKANIDLALPEGQPDVPLRLAVQRADRWERILSTAIARPAQNKLLLLVLPRPDGGARVIIAKDLPVPPPEPAAANQ